MKKRYLILTCGLIITGAALTACGTGSTSSTETVSEAASAYAGTTIYGEVTAVADSTVTINVGTQEEDSDELTLTGETAEIEVTDDTTISAQMGGEMGEPGEGEAPEMPDGEEPSGDAGEAPEKPEGEEDSESGEVPEKPEDGEEDADSDDAAEAETTEEADSDSQDETDSESEEAPEKPDGDAAEDGDGEAPEMPDGEAPDGEGGEMPSDMGGMSFSLSDISEGDTISVTYDEDGNVTEITILSGSSMGEMGGQQPGGSQSSGVDSYDAAAEYSEDTEVSDESYTSEGTDENAILVSGGASVTLDNITVDRTSSDSTGGDNSSFYGVGAAILTTEGTTTITNAEITTDAAGGAGVFSYGDGVTYVSDSTITTTQDTSGGIHVAGGGTLYASNLTVETSGESSAAIRSDRGGGTMVVDGGTYTTNGTGSPAAYSTADLTVSNAELIAKNSEAVCIEGLNSLTLYDCDVTGSMQDLDQNDCTWTVILYQSMSGDSEVGNSTFEMQGGSLTSNNGGMFYTTNTESTFMLSDVDFTYSEDSEFFLKCTGNANERGWGTEGENGADCSFTAIDQDMEGDVIWDSISQLDFYMMDGSTLSGAFLDDESNAGNGGSGYANLYISSDSTWVVTGDSTLTSLYSEGTIVDEDGNTVTIQSEDGTVYVEGTSSYVITVDNYETSADFSGASSLSESE